MKNVLIVLGVLVCCGIAQADVAVEIDGAGTTNPNPFSLGYSFTVNSDISVTALGKFDLEGDGLAADALARLYNYDTGAAIAEVTISASTAGEATGSYNTVFANIAPVTLSTGTTYLLAVEAIADEFYYGAPVTWADEINYIAGRATAYQGDPTMPATANGTTFPISYPASAAYLGPNMKFDNQSIDLAVTQPLARAIFQRDEQGTALVPVEGTYTGLPTQIEARAVVMAGYNGTPTGWQVIDSTPTGGAFSASLPVTTGGWYSIEVRIFNGNEYSSTATVNKVGVGEVFITSGQSNSANWGSPPMTPTNDTVSAWTGSGWRHGYDPQPIANGGSGSPWSRLGDILVERLGCPIGFYSSGYGGSTVDQWLPGTGVYYPRLETAINAMAEYGFRAILWHQGESDSLASTSAATYESRLNTVIAQSRTVAGWDVPWGVALASFHPYSSLSQEMIIRQGQSQVIAGDPLVFQGADTDDFHTLGWLSDVVHFDATGLLEHARWWEVSIMREFFPCDFEPDGIVDISDLAWIAKHWLDNNCKSVAGFSYGCNDCDLNNDDIVDILDLNICAFQWLQ